MLHLKDIKPEISIICKINGISCRIAKIQIEDNGLYICQNYKAGARCRDTLGFDYSWAIGTLTELKEKYRRNESSIEEYFRYAGVTDIKIVDPEWNFEENLI